MKDKNKSLVPYRSQLLSRLGKSIDITDKILKEQEDRFHILSWNFLFRHQSFFNRFFSTMYPFSEIELIHFYKKLEIGHEFISPAIDSEPLEVGKAGYGLVFNKNILWSEKLKELYTKEEDNHFFGYFIPANYFESLPLDIKEQVNVHLFFKQEQYNYHSYSSDFIINREIEDYYNDIFFKTQFSDLEVIRTIQSYECDFFVNGKFVNSLWTKIKKDLPDFNLVKFYDYVQIDKI